MSRKRNKYLLDGHPIIIIVELAIKVGINEAIFLQQAHWWLNNNAESERNYHDGHYWFYASVKTLVKHFPFWSEKTIRRITGDLIRKGLLITGNYSTLQLDRTTWYRIDYDTFDEVCGLIETNPFGQIDQIAKPKRKKANGKGEVPWAEYDDNAMRQDVERSGGSYTSRAIAEEGTFCHPPCEESR